MQKCRSAGMLTLFVVILLANASVLAFAIAAAMKWPTLRKALIAGVALCATVLALYQVIVDRGNPFTVLFTGLLVVMILRRIIW
jgi:hypothetical protein